ncbi:MAG: DUF3798 domain-containing protein [Treponema sp.]|nr:DUF3798 domain-containing protein [Treponema sp.]
MLKKLTGLALAVVILLAFASCADDDDAAPEGWRIGIITGTVSQGEEEYLAAVMMQQRFGSDRIIRTTYPDNFNAEMEVTIANTMSLADAGARAIVFLQAVPGTIAAIQRTREVFGDDIFFFVGVTHEPPAELAIHADIAMLSDDLSMGRVIVEQAYAMGADTFAHISFPRHLGMENIAARRALLMETAAEKGMAWVELTAPDPTAEGVAQTQMFILENVPRWVADHGQNTAFFSTNCAMQEPLITQIATHGGLYPLQCCPSPFHALPAAFNVSMEGREGDVEFLLAQLTDSVAAAGGTGRFSTWPIPINMLLVEVGVLYSIEYLEGNIGRHDRAALTRIINEVAARFDASVELSNWPVGDGTYLENFYRVLSDFVTF